MEDNEIDVVVGQGPGARSIKIPLPPFTLVGATTKTGLVSGPLHSRFGITLRLGFYEPREIAAIVRRSAGILRVETERRRGEAARAVLARYAAGPPTGWCGACATSPRCGVDGTISPPIVKRGLAALEVDDYGLDKVDREILDTIITKYDGGPVGSENPGHLHQ